MSDDPNTLSRRTTPTWEVELLLSGALVFSLLNLPTLLDSAVLQILPSLSSELVTGLTLVSVYLRAGLVALAMAFVLHLMLRVYWVALVGVNSVYPDGPRWERVKSGVHGLAMRKRNWVTLSVRIETVDNAASLVFASGVAMGVLMVSLSFMAGAFLFLSDLLGRYSMLSLSTQAWLIVLLSATFAPAILAGLIDYFFGTRILADGRLAKAIVAILTVYDRFPGVRYFNVLANTIGLNLPKRLLLFVIFMLSAFAISELSTSRPTRQPHLQIFNTQQDSPWVSKPRHYRDQRRGTQKFFAVPTIASRELGESALDLFVPLLADRHPNVFFKHCPELAEFAQANQPTLARDRAWLSCAGRVLTPSLDGVKLNTDDLLYTVDAQSGFEGLLLRVPNHIFTKGRHVISVQNVADEDALEFLAPFQIVVFR